MVMLTHLPIGVLKLSAERQPPGRGNLESDLEVLSRTFSSSFRDRPKLPTELPHRLDLSLPTPSDAGGKEAVSSRSQRNPKVSHLLGHSRWLEIFIKGA